MKYGIAIALAVVFFAGITCFASSAIEDFASKVDGKNGFVGCLNK